MKNLQITMEQFIEEACESIKKEADGGPVLCALSGGVDSSVCAALAQRAIGNDLACIFIDTGFMRKNEAKEVEDLFKNAFSINLACCHSEDRFLDKVKGVTEPEMKRKLIGEEFIRVFEEVALECGPVGSLLQGTIYSDVMESGEDGHKSVKAHHNVGGMPTNIKFKNVLEPLKYLYKDEVRECGRTLGLPERLTNRQPFPGPGLAIRCMGEITKQRLALLREADAIFCEEIEKAGLQNEIQQYFAILPGVMNVGVRNNERCYEEMVALRAISTKDIVTASPVRLPYELLETVTNRITIEVPGINRVVLDLTPKPPGTIEWE